MRFFRTGTLILVVLLVGGGLAFGLSDSVAHDVQINISEVVLVGLNNTGVITLATVAPVTAGDPVTATTDATKILDYSSLVPTLTTRTIDAQVTTGTLPDGISLLVTASAPAAGLGTLGASVGQVSIVVGSATTLINGIGSCHTTIGGGHTLTYTLGIVTLASLDTTDSQLVTVTLTLTDAS